MDTFFVRPEAGSCSCGSQQFQYHFRCPHCGCSFCCACYKKTGHQGEAKCPSCACTIFFASRSPTTPKGRLTGPPDGMKVFPVPKNIYTVFHRYGMTGGLVMLKIIERTLGDNQPEADISNAEFMDCANANADDVRKAIRCLEEDGLIPTWKEPLDKT